MSKNNRTPQGITEKVPDHFRGKWFAACEASKLCKSPTPVKLFGIPLVLFRHSDGIACLLDRCPHRNVPLRYGSIENSGLIRCPYHGWAFDRTGNCVEIPGRNEARSLEKLGVPGFKAIERFGFIFINITGGNEKECFPKPPPRYFDTDYASFIWSSSAEGSLVDVCENFLDATHTHYVHAGLIRTASKRQTVTATVRQGIEQVEVEYTGEGKQSGLISKLFETDRAKSFGRFILPSTAELEYCSTKGTVLTMTAYLTPRDAMNLQQSIHAVISLKTGYIPAKLKWWIIRPFFLKALRQDQHILKIQSANLKDFNGASFRHTELDLIRPGIESILKGARFDKTEHTFTLQL